MSRTATEKKSAQQTERKCIATGEVQPKHGLIRFVVGPDQSVVPDVLEKLPGRGIWVAADRHALEKACKTGLFSRSAKTAVKPSEHLLGDLERQLARRVVDLISLARKSGRAVAGYEKVKDWLTKDQAEKKILTLKKDLFNIRFKKVNNQITNPAQYNEIKKSIARLNTTIKNSK